MRRPIRKRTGPSGLWCVFEDPDHDARDANVLWRRAACGGVLPVAALVHPSDGTSRQLDFTRMQCRVTVHRDDGVQHVLFSDGGRSLQLEVSGDRPLDNAMLLTPALPICKLAASRLLGVKRLSDLTTHGQLRPSLYPKDRRAPRLIRVAQALDGWLGEATHREIGTALFGAARVERDWNHPGGHMRDQVRRAIGYGRTLMDGGYQRFLN